MRYTLWSRGRLVGHTDLDIHTVTSTMRQGFVEPTAEGRQVLADATGVWRAIAEVKRGCRAAGRERNANDDALVLESMSRREGLDLELRDHDGAVFESAFIRITDLFDMNHGLVDEMSDTEEEREAAFQIHLSTLSAEARAEALTQRAESDAEIEAAVSEFLEDREESRMFESDYPPPAPEDPRWDTMQYLLQAHLKAPEWEELFGEVD
jgi:hypothetical protein